MRKIRSQSHMHDPDSNAKILMNERNETNLGAYLPTVKS